MRTEDSKEIGQEETLVSKEIAIPPYDYEWITRPNGKYQDGKAELYYSLQVWRSQGKHIITPKCDFSLFPGYYNK